MSATAFLLAAVSAWATISALGYDQSELTGPTRIKIAAVILTPLLFLILGPGIPVTTVLLYYLAGFPVVYLGLYSLSLLLGTPRRQHQPPPDPEPDPPETDDDEPPVIFIDQKKR